MISVAESLMLVFLLQNKLFVENEWKATVVIWTAAFIAAVVVVLWEIFFTPDIYRLQTESLGRSNASAVSWISHAERVLSQSIFGNILLN